MISYSHTQKGQLCLILYGWALACFAIAWMVGDVPGNLIAVAVGFVIALGSPAVHHMTVIDQGEVLAIRFGPIPLFRMTSRCADMVVVEVGRTLILDGLGIHSAFGAAGSGMCGAGIASLSI